MRGWEDAVDVGGGGEGCGCEGMGGRLWVWGGEAVGMRGWEDVGWEEAVGVRGWGWGLWV